MGILRTLTGVTDELQRLAEDLTADYLHGRWRPEATEEHRARILSTHAATDGGLDGLAAGGLLATSSIEQMLRPHPMLDSWRLAPVLRAYPDGSLDGQALVRDLLDAIAVAGFSLLPPRPLRYIEAPARYDGEAVSLFLGGGITGCPNWQMRAVLSSTRSAPQPSSSTRAANATRPGRRKRPGNRLPGSTSTCASPTSSCSGSALTPSSPSPCTNSAHMPPGALASQLAHAPRYPRRLDVVEQLRHARPDVTVHDSLHDTVRAAAALLPTAPTTEP